MTQVYVVINQPATYEDVSETEVDEAVDCDNKHVCIISVCTDFSKAMKAYRLCKPERGELVAIYKVPFNETKFSFQGLVERKHWKKEYDEDDEDEEDDEDDEEKRV